MTFAEAPRSNQLETAYRRLLRRYPAAYRVQREEEIVATLMEAAEPGQRRPSGRDSLDLSVSAVRAHLRLNVNRVVRDGVAAAAMPAALLLLGLLASYLLRIVWTVAASDLDLAMWLSIQPRRFVLVAFAVPFGCALLTGRTRLTRLIAVTLGATILVAKLSTQYIGVRWADVVVIASLAALVAAAPTGALALRSGRFAVPAMLLAALPFLKSVVFIAWLQGKVHFQWFGDIMPFVELSTYLVVLCGLGLILRRRAVAGALTATGLVAIAVSSPILEALRAGAQLHSPGWAVVVEVGALTSASLVLIAAAYALLDPLLTTRRMPFTAA